MIAPIFSHAVGRVVACPLSPGPAAALEGRGCRAAHGTAARQLCMSFACTQHAVYSCITILFRNQPCIKLRSQTPRGGTITISRGPREEADMRCAEIPFVHTQLVLRQHAQRDDDSVLWMVGFPRSLLVVQPHRSHCSAAFLSACTAQRAPTSQRLGWVLHAIATPGCGPVTRTSRPLSGVCVRLACMLAACRQSGVLLI